MMALPMPNLSLGTPPATKGKRPLRHLTATDKIEAIQRIHDGESKASVARDIGVPESTLRGWCKNEEKLRYMSRQSLENSEKLSSEAALASMAAADFLAGGPPEKRMKLDASFFGGGNGKLRYDDLSRYSSRSAAGGLDLSSGGGSDKRAADLSHLSALSADYSSALSALNGTKSVSAKGYGADLTKPNDPTKADMSMAAISPLTSLSHLSGMSSIANSPLALSFNDIATNLNLLATLNSPSLAAMSGLSSLGAASAASKTLPRPKIAPSHSPRSENDKSPGLTVKNLAKLQQKSGSGGGTGSGSVTPEAKKPSSMPSRDAPVDDALWYWLKSQQTMLGLNNLYSQMPRTASSPQSSPSTQSGAALNASTPTMNKLSTPPIISQPQQTPPIASATDDKTSWFWQWYKNFGAQLVAEKQAAANGGASAGGTPKQQSYENILYSHLTKSAPDSLNNNLIDAEPTPKPEDLSSHHHHHHQHHKEPPIPPSAAASLRPPTEPDEMDEVDEEEEEEANTTNPPETEDDQVSAPPSPANSEDRSAPTSITPTVAVAAAATITAEDEPKDAAKVKEELDNLLSNNNNDAKSETSEPDDTTRSAAEALEHGEKFLQWLEACSDPSITAMQVMQFRLLISTLKANAEQRMHSSSSGGEERAKVRRRK